MNPNEETKYMNPETENQEVVEENVENVENSKGETWKAVTIGGVTGILMGAGGLYAMNAFAEETPGSSSGKPLPAGSVRTNDETGMKVASVNDEMSFGEAFATARQAVGEGGVFHWRGNVYNTFTKEEWDAMTPAERNEFARAAQPEIAAEAKLHPHHVDTHHDVADNHHTEHKTAEKKTADDDDIKGGGKKTDDDDIAGGGKKTTDDDDIKIVKNDDDDIKDVTPDDDDIQIVGTDEVDGHAVAFVDVTGDGEANVAIIDVDNDRQLSDPDIIVDNEGNAVTFGGEVIATSDASYMQDDSLDPSADAGMDATLL